MLFANTQRNLATVAVAWLTLSGIATADLRVSSRREGSEMTTSAMELKHAAVSLVLSGPEGCRKALPVLREALHLYRAGRGDSGTHRLVREGNLIDEINVLTYTAYCNVVLAENTAFARAIADLIMVREEISRMPYLARFANPAGGAFQQVATLVDSWRSQFKTDNEKKEATEKIRRDLNEAVRFLVRQGNKREALVLSENMRGRAFADLLALKTKLIAPIQRGSVDAADIPSPIASDYVSLRDLLSIVEESDSTTLVYHILDDRLFIWVVLPRLVRQERIVFVEVPGGERKIGPLIQSLKNLFQPPDRGGENVEDIQVDQKRALKLLRALHSHLFAQIPKGLLPLNPSDPLTIVPHGVLFNVPFTALASPPPPAGTGDFLVNRHATAITPSIAILRYSAQFGEFPSGGQTLLALVNPKPLPTIAENLPALDTTQREFPALVELFPHPARNTVLYGPDALPRMLQSGASQHSVVYIGTHAFASENKPLRSWIALSGAGEAGKVTIPNILRAHLQADLVILAACETGRGKITGDGVDGLGRAFVFAGARSLLVSLWKVGEISTLKLMDQFLREWLQNDTSKVEALRRAQVTRSTAVSGHPESWAAFVMVGNWR